MLSGVRWSAGLWVEAILDCGKDTDGDGGTFGEVLLGALQAPVALLPENAR